MHIASTCNVLELRTPFRPPFLNTLELVECHWQASTFDFMEFLRFWRQPPNFRDQLKGYRPLSAPLFYTFVNFTIWTKFFLITIWSRNALVWLCWVRFKKPIRSASMSSKIQKIDPDPRFQQPESGNNDQSAKWGITAILLGIRIA